LAFNVLLRRAEMSACAVYYFAASYTRNPLFSVRNGGEL